MYNNEMLESMKKVAAKRAENAALEPRRMTADEKDALLATYHPDYKQNEFSVLEIGANKGEKVPAELAALLQANSRIKPVARPERQVRRARSRIPAYSHMISYRPPNQNTII